MTKEEILIQELDKTPCCYMYEDRNHFIDGGPESFEAVFSAMELYKNQELSELTQKYNSLVSLQEATRAVNHLSGLENKELKEKYEKLKGAFEGLLSEYSKLLSFEPRSLTGERIANIHNACEYFRAKAGLKEQ